jgi:hypothetical protein
MSSHSQYLNVVLNSLEFASRMLSLTDWPPKSAQKNALPASFASLRILRAILAKEMFDSSDRGPQVLSNSGMVLPEKLG